MTLDQYTRYLAGLHALAKQETDAITEKYNAVRVTPPDMNEVRQDFDNMINHLNQAWGQIQALRDNLIKAAARASEAEKKLDDKRVVLATTIPKIPVAR